MPIQLANRTDEQRRPWMHLGTNGAAQKLPVTATRMFQPIEDNRKRDDLQRVRLSWYPPLMEDVMATVGTNRTRTFAAGVATYRFLEMVKRRLPRYYRLHIWTNPLGGNGTLDVWVTRK